MSSARSKRRSPLPSYYARPLKRLAEIECLAHWRRITNGYTDPIAALAVAGHSLASLEGWIRRNRPRHPGISFETAQDFLDRSGLDLTARDVMEIVDAVHRSRLGDRPFVMTSVEAGRLLSLTRDERTNLGIVTIEAIDEAPAARAARMAEWKQTNDRLRRQQSTDKKRAEKGLPPLDRSAPKVPKIKPWDAAGMPKSTYLRRKAKGTLPSETGVSHTYAPDVGETTVSQTYTVGSETVVSQTFRRNIEVVRHDGLTSHPTHQRDAASGAAPERAASPGEISRAETAFLLLLGRGEAEAGRQIAARITPELAKRCIASLGRGQLGRDERVELEMQAIHARQTMRQAS